jgi:Skp family chaperone for outer membrane proteins
MKKTVFIIFMLALSSTILAQTRGVKVGYIDMEYILQNVPDYTEAKNQLELKAQKWKQEIDAKRNEINLIKETLKNERVLLTKELIEEREEEIAFLEAELNDYQQKRFGPMGDLVTQKAVLIKPIQDQVFTTVQDLAEAQKYDFILDKSSDLSILFANKRFDLSDRVIRALTRSNKREQLSKKEQKAMDAKEAKEDFVDDNPELAARKKLLDDKKAQRDSLVAARKLESEQKRLQFEEKRKKLLEEKEAKKNGTVSEKNTEIETNKKEENKTQENKDKVATGTTEEKNIQPVEEKKPTAAQEAKQKSIEDRKKEIEERKQKILADREAAKKAREEKLNQNKDKNEENKNEN